MEGVIGGGVAVKMVGDYLEQALNFERMAAQEKHPEIKLVFDRKLASDRAKQFGLDDPRYVNKPE